MISHAATVLKSVYRDFPEGTVHLASVDALREQPRGIALEIDNHLFVGLDSGLFSMISDQKPLKKVQIALAGRTFPARDVFADVALQLASGRSLSDVGQPMDQMVELLARQLKVTKREIVGNVVQVDHFGNLITNISKNEFDKMIELNGVSVQFTVRFGRESFSYFHENFADVDSGDCYVLFNSIGYLQIGINKGNAAQLLGLTIDTPIHIEFKTTQ